MKKISAACDAPFLYHAFMTELHHAFMPYPLYATISYPHSVFLAFISQLASLIAFELPFIVLPKLWIIFIWVRPILLVKAISLGLMTFH